MKQLLFVFLLIGSLEMLGQAPKPATAKYCDCREMPLGETFKYKIKYGWFKIGEAEVKLDSKLHYFGKEPHYKIYFSLKAQGFLALFSNLNLDWYSYTSAETFRPHNSVQTVSNGKRVNSYYDVYTYSDSIHVQSWKNQNQKSKFAFEEIKKPFVDALGTYLYVRSMTLDMSRPVNMQLYYSKRIFDFGITPSKSIINKSDRNLKSYKIRLPDIEEFSVDQESYVIFRGERNIIEEMKLATSDGNIYLVLEE